MIYICFQIEYSYRISSTDPAAHLLLVAHLPPVAHLSPVAHLPPVARSSPVVLLSPVANPSPVAHLISGSPSERIICVLFFLFVFIIRVYR